MKDKNFKELDSLLDKNMRKLEKLKKRIDNQKRYPEELEYSDEYQGKN